MTDHPNFKAESDTATWGTALGGRDAILNSWEVQLDAALRRVTIYAESDPAASAAAQEEADELAALLEEARKTP